MVLDLVYNFQMICLTKLELQIEYQIQFVQTDMG
jgi:hypothetical protein